MGIALCNPRDCTCSNCSTLLDNVKCNFYVLTGSVSTCTYLVIFRTHNGSRVVLDDNKKGIMAVVIIYPNISRIRNSNCNQGLFQPMNFRRWFGKPLLFQQMSRQAQPSLCSASFTINHNPYKGNTQGAGGTIHF